MQGDGKSFAMRRWLVLVYNHDPSPMPDPRTRTLATAARSRCIAVAPCAAVGYTEVLKWHSLGTCVPLFHRETLCHLLCLISRLMSGPEIPASQTFNERRGHVTYDDPRGASETAPLCSWTHRVRSLACLSGQPPWTLDDTAGGLLWP